MEATPAAPLSPMLSFVQRVYNFGTRLGELLGGVEFEYRFSSVFNVPHSDGLNWCELIGGAYKDYRFDVLWYEEDNSNISIHCRYTGLVGDPDAFDLACLHQSIDDVAVIAERIKAAANWMAQRKNARKVLPV